MVFSELLDNITNAFQNNPPSVNVAHKAAINELQQGMVLLNNRRAVLNNLKRKSSLLEGFDTSKLDNVTQNELSILSSLESEYQQKLSSYSRNYKSFMETYYSAIKQVSKCKSDCLTTYPKGSSAYSFKREACKAGCDLKGPYVSKCKNTFVRSRVGQADCDTITKDKCLNGNALPGKDSIINSIDYADSNNTTIKKGCCDCGGGAGGPPSAMIRQKTIKSCDDAPNAFGYAPGQGGYTKVACHQAPIASPQTNKNMWQNYEKLTVENEELINLAKEIFEKINSLKGVNSKINTKLSDEERKLKNQLAVYGNVYSEILDNSGKTNQTVDGQLEDIFLKEKSSSMKLLLWGSLATLLILLSIERMRK